MTAPADAAALEATLVERLAAAIILYEHPIQNALTRPDDPLVMLRSDPNFFVCRDALDLAAVLAPLVAGEVALAVEEALSGAVDVLAAMPWADPGVGVSRAAVIDAVLYGRGRP